MDLIHARAVQDGQVWRMRELAQIVDFSKYNSVMSETAEVTTANDFEIQLSHSAFRKYGMQKDDWLYIPRTEWGGKIETIENTGDQVLVSGASFRGITSRHIIVPPYDKGFQDYYTLNNVELNLALKLLYGQNTAQGSIFDRYTDHYGFFSSEDSGATLSYPFRFDNFLEVVTKILKSVGYRLEVTHDYFDYSSNEFDDYFSYPANQNYQSFLYRVGAKPITDYSNIAYFNDDYGITITSKTDSMNDLKYLICLGSGDLAAREVVVLQRTAAGGIVSVQEIEPDLNSNIGYLWNTDVYDYPSSESREELVKGGTERLITEMITVDSVEFTIDSSKEFFLGDIIGGYDNITKIETKKTITKKELTIDENGERITYTVG